MGSDILTDDGIGSTIVKHLKKENELKHCDFKTALLFNLDLVQELEGYDLIIIIDATSNKDESTGKLSIYHLNDFKETLHLSNIHETSFVNSINLWKKIGFKITDEVYIISIEIKEFLVFSESLSKEIQNKYDRILKFIFEWIKEKSATLNPRMTYSI